MTSDQKQQLAEKLVSNFINKFEAAIGTKPIVKYSIESDIPTLNEIYNAVNEHYRAKERQEDISIADDHRDISVVYYRNIFYSISREYKYTLNAIGQIVGRDHATVLHGSRQISEANELKLKIKQELLKL